MLRSCWVRFRRRRGVSTLPLSPLGGWPAACDTAAVRIRTVVFDLFITLTDWDAERRRPGLMDDMAAALGVDPLKFSSLMRATFTERVAGRMGDARATFSALATQLGCDPSPAELDQVVAMRHEQTRQTLAPRAGALDIIKAIRTDGTRLAWSLTAPPKPPCYGHPSRTRPWWMP